jgi:hypothetical protein
VMITVLCRPISHDWWELRFCDERVICRSIMGVEKARKMQFIDVVEAAR